MTVTVPDEGELGPAMKALPTERMRAFVLALLDQGGRNFPAAYRAAGYGGNPESIRANAFKLGHDERVQAAIREEALNRLGGAGIAATSFLVDTLLSDDPAIKTTTKMKAAAMILNRTGLHETTEHKVTTRKEDNEGEKVDRIVALAQTLGLDAKALLGRAGYKMPATSDVSEKIVDVEAEQVGTTEGLEDLL